MPGDIKIKVQIIIIFGRGLSLPKPHLAHLQNGVIPPTVWVILRGQ